MYQLFLGLMVVVLYLILPIGAQAKIFRNAYVAFELPPNWKCDLEQTEWVCRSENAKEAKEAIIILTAKMVGPTDSLSTYEMHLKTPKVVVDRRGQQITSEIKHVKKVKINDHLWIDGWHLSSEVPNYYTRYLATVKEQIEIL